jgi:hypothetical protein
MLIVFFNSHSIVHKEFVPLGQKVNHAFYKDVLERLWKRVQQVQRDIADNWVLHYSPDLALCDFYLFPKLKSKLKGHHFGTMGNAQKL